MGYIITQVDIDGLSDIDSIDAMISEEEEEIHSCLLYTSDAADE